MLRTLSSPSACCTLPLPKILLLVSFDRDGAYASGLRVRWWDFLFYASFGLVVTSFRPHRRGAARFQLSHRARGLRHQSRAARREAAAHRLDHCAHRRYRRIISLLLWDLPSGAAIVCTFGALLILVSLLGLLRRRPLVLQS